MGIKGLCYAPLAGPGGTQRPTVQCIAMKVQELEAAEWKEGGKAGCSSLVPAVPPLSLLPRNPPTHTGEIACLSRPAAYFPNPTGTQPPFTLPHKSCELALCRGGIELKTNPATFPSSQWRGGG